MLVGELFDLAQTTPTTFWTVSVALPTGTTIQQQFPDQAGAEAFATSQRSQGGAASVMPPAGAVYTPTTVAPTVMTSWTVSARMPNGQIIQQQFPDQTSAQNYANTLTQQGGQATLTPPGAAAPAVTTPVVTSTPYMPPPPYMPSYVAPTYAQPPAYAAPVAGGIPIVQLGPIRLLASNGMAIPGVIASVSAGGRMLTQTQVTGGLFQMNMDRTDFDQGGHIVFGASGYGSYDLPAAQIVCNTGVRDAAGNVIQMTNNNCPIQSFTLVAASEMAPPQQQYHEVKPAPRRRPKGASAAAPVAPVVAASDQAAPGMILGLSTNTLLIGAGAVGLLGVAYMMTRRP
jgi:hypothetical protein